MTQDYFADDAAAAAVLQLSQDPQEALRATEALEDHSALAAAPEPAPAQESAPEPEPPEEDVPEFDPAHRKPFTGLLYVGALTAHVELFGHAFTISTPTQTERLQMGPVIEPYQNTVTAEIAYQTVLVAAYLVDVDKIKLPEPVLINPKETALHDRFRWAMENLRRPVIDKLFEECLKLDRQVDDVLAAMGKASG